MVKIGLSEIVNDIRFNILIIMIEANTFTVGNAPHFKEFLLF